MAIADPYAQVGDYYDRSEKTDGDDDQVIANQLIAASRLLDRRLGWPFGQDAADTIRVYTVPPRTLNADDARWLDLQTPLAQAPTEVIVDEDGDGDFADETAWVLDTDFELMPTNAAEGPEPRPYYSLHIPSWSDKSWPVGYRVRVTGIHGWPAVPAAIKEATVELVRLLRLETPRATREVNMGLDTLVSTTPEAQRIVSELARAPYRNPVRAF